MTQCPLSLSRAYDGATRASAVIRGARMMPAVPRGLLLPSRSPGPARSYCIMAASLMQLQRRGCGSHAVQLRYRW